VTGWFSDFAMKEGRSVEIASDPADQTDMKNMGYYPDVVV
jgi:hypothetical protein